MNDGARRALLGVHVIGRAVSGLLNRARGRLELKRAIDREAAASFGGTHDAPTGRLEGAGRRQAEAQRTVVEPSARSKAAAKSAGTRSTSGVEPDGADEVWSEAATHESEGVRAAHAIESVTVRKPGTTIPGGREAAAHVAEPERSRREGARERDAVVARTGACVLTCDRERERGHSATDEKPFHGVPGARSLWAWAAASFTQRRPSAFN